MLCLTCNVASIFSSLSISICLRFYWLSLELGKTELGHCFCSLNIYYQWMHPTTPFVGNEAIDTGTVCLCVYIIFVQLNERKSIFDFPVWYCAYACLFEDFFFHVEPVNISLFQEQTSSLNYPGGISFLIFLFHCSYGHSVIV